ncbi:MAG: fluoride efflux transporter CrcB [Psittacicella sp.]
MNIAKSILLIFLGAGTGATIRWALSLLLNSMTSVIDVGTLTANYLGCFIMGIVTGIFFSFPNISSDVKVFLVTGFLGALTTFSSFSGEVISRLMGQHYLNGLFVIIAHVGGSLTFTILGIILWRVLSTAL